MGKGVEEEVEDRLMRAAQNGDWLILENLHLQQIAFLDL
jgi:hypothetical protein